MPSTRRRNRRNQKKNNKTPKLSTTPWGYHLIIDAYQCNPKAIGSKTVLAAFVQELIRRIHMVTDEKPHIIPFHKGNLVGLTMVQRSETVDITGHVMKHANHAHIDLFSRNSFNPATVLNVCSEYFSPRHTKTRFRRRQA